MDRPRQSRSASLALDAEGVMLFPGSVVVDIWSETLLMFEVSNLLRKSRSATLPLDAHLAGRSITWRQLGGKIHLSQVNFHTIVVRFGVHSYGN